MRINLTTLIASLQACASHNNLAKGKQIHAQLLINGFLTSPISSTSLINMYSRCNSIADALTVFHSSHHHHQNVFTYNAIIAGCTANHLSRYALQFYWLMRVAGIVADNFTFPCVIKASTDLNQDLEGRMIHGVLLKFGLGLDLFIASALTHMYLKYGMIDEANQVFDDLPLKNDVVLWNSMINGFAQIGEYYKAMEVFAKMGDQGVVPSKFTITGILSVFTMMEDIRNGRTIHGFAIKLGHDSGVAVLNSLIDMYGKCKSMEDAFQIFETMPEKDVFSWNCIIFLHGQSGDHDGTLRFFRRMLLAGYKPDLVTVTNVLPACAHLAALTHGRGIHSFMVINGFDKCSNDINTNDVYLQNTVINMYAKCGSMREARLVFDKMGFKDVATWNTMIMGYGLHGFSDEALYLFLVMCEAKFEPDEVTFVGVLSACSHGGLVGKGRELLSQMQSKYGVVPNIEHYTCIIDMLGRAGQLEEAYELLSAMPVVANPVIWRAYLAACQLHGKADLAEFAAQNIFELQPRHCGSYVLLSNFYGAAGRYDDVSELRNTMRQHNVKKEPGCSWIELSDGVCSFVTGDWTHPEDYLIYTALNSLSACLYEYGYMSTPHHSGM